MNHVKLSIIIPCRDKNDPKLAELLKSIESQDFPKEEMETLVITEGTSESAKAIGIRKAKGDVIGILASDNELIGSTFLNTAYSFAKSYQSSYPMYYYWNKNDNILNRYFALIGGNDPLAFYLCKNDRRPHGIKHKCGWTRTVGDNGFFILKSIIEKTDLDNYYHIDNAIETEAESSIFNAELWHKTGGNIFSFFRKRYRYGLQHAFNPNRRWYLVDFRQPKDIVRLAWFIFATLTLVQPLCLSLRGYLKIRDLAWFLHPLLCLLTLLTYGLLMARLGLRMLFRLLSAPMAVQRA